MADRNTKVRGSQIKDGDLTKADLTADGEQQGNNLTVQSDGSVDWNEDTKSIAIIIDGGGSVITTGIQGQIEIPFNAVITQVTLLADQSGSIVVDINKGTFANFPTLSSITASATPTLSSAQKVQDSTLTGWTTAISAGDVLEFEVDSVTTITRCAVVLKVRKT